jgi:hypothetical protein
MLQCTTPTTTIIKKFFKGRSYVIPVCRWHDLIPERSGKLHQKFPRYNKSLQQSSRIQNQSAKSLAFPYTYSEQIERISYNNSIYNILRK